MFRIGFTGAMPKFDVVKRGLFAGAGSWLLYGGRVVAHVPASATITPDPEDEDPLDFAVVMELDIVAGRLACVSLTAERLADGPPISSEALRRIPVAEYVADAGRRGDVLRERVWTGEKTFKEVPFTFPPPDFAKDGMTEEALEQVSRIHAMAQATGQKTTGILLTEYAMPRPTATRWLQVARRRGVLVEEHQQLDEAPEPTEAQQQAGLEYLNKLRAPKSAN